jgi:hypothetical protein
MMSPEVKEITDDQIQSQNNILFYVIPVNITTKAGINSMKKKTNVGIYIIYLI